MELYDIIEAAGKAIGCNLVLHKSMREHPKFKVYKIFIYNLYKVDNEKSLILTVSKVVNAPYDSITKSWEECDRLYLNEFFKWFLDKDAFQQISNSNN